MPVNVDNLKATANANKGLLLPLAAQLGASIVVLIAIMTISRGSFSRVPNGTYTVAFACVSMIASLIAIGLVLCKRELYDKASLMAPLRARGYNHMVSTPTLRPYAVGETFSRVQAVVVEVKGATTASRYFYGAAGRC